MNYTFDFITDKQQLENLGKIAQIDEPIDHNCIFIGTMKDGELIGVAGVDLHNLSPRFKHIIVHPKYQKTRLAYLLMKRIEECILSKGYYQYTAYILNSRKFMQDYAKKFNMLEYSITEKGKWFYKDIINAKEIEKCHSQFASV